MGKEFGQAILILGAILLVGFFFQQSNNEDLSGEAVNRGKIRVAPLPSPPISQYCGLTDWTQHVLSSIPGAVSIRKVIDPQDSLYQTFIVVTRDLNNNDQWSLYDIGVDGKLSNDDIVYPGSTVGFYQSQTLTIFITSDDGSTNRKLFWTEANTPTTLDIKSCDLPNCNNRITEASLTGVFMTIVPSLITDRIYIIERSSTTTGASIISCSRNQANNDWCGGSSGNFIIHVTGISSSLPSTVKDSGFSYYDWTASRETFFSIGNNQVVALPIGSYQNSITPLGGGSLGLLLRFVNLTPAQQRTELLLVDLNTGQNLVIMETTALTKIAPWFITTLSGVTTFFQNNEWWISPVVFQSKLSGQPTKTIWTETTLPIDALVPTVSGNVIAKRGSGIVSFDCTP